MNYEQDAANPLDSPVMRKTFRLPKPKQREIVAKEVIDEVIFMPEPLANRLKTYIQGKGLKEDDQVFNICHGTARTMINKLGEKVGIKLNPHDLRRHSATYASRNGVPLEIISKVFFAIRT
jgi:integrase